MTSHEIQPPIAPSRPFELPANGGIRIDEWYWLNQKEDPEVIELLNAENAHTQAVLAQNKALEDDLFDEIVARIQETDLSVPVRKGSWRYYHRTEEAKQYAIHCRKPLDSDSETVLLDENEVARDAEFFSLGSFHVTADGTLLAYSVDTEGNEVYSMRFKDLRTGGHLDDILEDTFYGTAWSSDNSAFFYVKADGPMRPFQVWRHHMGTQQSADELIYQENDERFFVGVGNSKTDGWIVISASSSLSNETRLLRADDPMGEFQLVCERRPDFEYRLSHHRDATGERFYVLTNEDAPNFKLMITEIDALGPENWKEVVAHREDTALESVESFENFLVLSERRNAIAGLSILDIATGELAPIDQPEEVHMAHSSGNAEFETDTVRFTYTSMVTPPSVYEIDVSTNERKLLKQQPVLGGYDPSQYTSERLWADAHDGTRIPISIVYRKDRKSEDGPALLYGYGSYEVSMDAGFSSLRLSLLDRGFAFAIAHVRGGGDMGRHWYENGKFQHKRNTFTDFIACAEHLIQNGYTSPRRLGMRGGSAGGMLMGAVVNMRPDLFGAVVADVPFVDVLTTMLDESLPLTIHEYEEWGDPRQPEIYEYMKSYSPYDNVSTQSYPAMLVTAGLNDPLVSYWEPAKWVQRLRKHNTGDKPILLKTEMGAGHQGPSGRYDAWRDEAFTYAFLLRMIT